jgi:uncharacterized membrane protein YqjE
VALIRDEQAQQQPRDRLERGRQEFREIRGDVSELADDLRTLAQKEAELARTEMGEQAGLAVRAAIWGGLAGISALLLLTFAFLTLMFGLNEAMDLWLAALVTTIVILALTAVAALMAYTRFRQISVVPKRTMHSVREDVAWARRQLNLNAR